MIIFYGVLTGKGSQVTSHYLFWKSTIHNTILTGFDIIVNDAVIPKPAFDNFFLLS